MKVLIECFWYKEGGPYFAYGMIKGLVENGVEVYALTTDLMENKLMWDELLPASHIFYWNGYPSIRKSYTYMHELLLIKNKFKNELFDYVIVTHPGKCDIKIRHFLNYRNNVMILHDVVPHSSTEKKTTRLIYRMVSKYDKVLVLTQSYVEIVENRLGVDREKILVMRHGMMTYPRARVINKSVDTNINYLYFGRIDGYKGLSVLAKAYKTLKSKYPNITLRVVGNGDFSEYADDYNSLENVTIVNQYVKDDEVATIFEVPNTVLVLPYIDATQSGVISIAYDFGVPIIASNVGGIKEQLFNGSVGLLYENNDPEELCEKMSRFVNDKNYYDEQSKIVREYRMRMEWSYVTNELLSQLESKG